MLCGTIRFVPIIGQYRKLFRMECHMAYLGKNGSDAVFFALKAVCRVVNRYHVKLDAAIDQAVTDGKISSAQATIAHTFVDGALATCAIFQLVSENSGF